MAKDQHPLDDLADELNAAGDSAVAGQAASADYWELELAADDSVGDYPQAMLPDDDDIESAELGTDGFPVLPNELPVLSLQRAAKWTDVLSSTLWSDSGFLVNQDALAVFKQCNLGNYREYPVRVRDKKRGEREYTYVFINNDVALDAIDFERSEFYVTDIVGIPQSSVDLNSFEEWVDLQDKANAGELDGCEEFSELDYRKLFFKSGHAPSVDIFTFERIGIRVYASAQLKSLIEKSGITGLNIKPNKRVFADR